MRVAWNGFLTLVALGTCSASCELGFNAPTSILGARSGRPTHLLVDRASPCTAQWRKRSTSLKAVANDAPQYFKDLASALFDVAAAPVSSPAVTQSVKAVASPAAVEVGNVAGALQKAVGSSGAQNINVGSSVQTLQSLEQLLPKGVNPVMVEVAAASIGLIFLVAMLVNQQGDSLQAAASVTLTPEKIPETTEPIKYDYSKVVEEQERLDEISSSAKSRLSEMMVKRLEKLSALSYDTKPMDAGEEGKEGKEVSLAKKNALEANRKQWGIGEENAAKGKREPSLAKLNAVERNREQWGIGKEASVSEVQKKNEEVKPMVRMQPCMAKANAVEQNRKQWGIGKEEEEGAPAKAEKSTVVNLAKLNAVEQNKQQWGIGAETKEERKDEAPVPKVTEATKVEEKPKKAPMEPCMAKLNALERNKMQWGIGAKEEDPKKAESSSEPARSSSMEPCLAKLNAVERNREQWGIGAEGEVAEEEKLMGWEASRAITKTEVFAIVRQSKGAAGVELKLWLSTRGYSGKRLQDVVEKVEEARSGKLKMDPWDEKLERSIELQKSAKEAKAEGEKLMKQSMELEAQASDALEQRINELRENVKKRPGFWGLGMAQRELNRVEQEMQRTIATVREIAQTQGEEAALQALIDGYEQVGLKDKVVLLTSAKECKKDADSALARSRSLSKEADELLVQANMERRRSEEEAMGGKLEEAERAISEAEEALTRGEKQEALSILQRESSALLSLGLQADPRASLSSLPGRLNAIVRASTRTVVASSSTSSALADGEEGASGAIAAFSLLAMLAGGVGYWVSIHPEALKTIAQMSAH